MKKLIAVDLDGVLSDTLSSFIQFHNEVYKTNLTKKHFHSEYYWEILNESKEETIRKFDQFTKTLHFDDIQPISGAKGVTTKLSTDHDVIVITARQIELTEQTKKWIKRHFPKTFKNVHVINHALLAKKGKTISKGELCRELGVDIIIEDSLHHAQDCKSDKTSVIILDQLWNKGDLSEGIYRVNSWQEIPSHPLLKINNN